MIDDIIIFNPDKPIPCPACGDDREKNKSFWIDKDGSWYFTCFECGLEWEAKAKRVNLKEK